MTGVWPGWLFGNRFGPGRGRLVFALEPPLAVRARKRRLSPALHEETDMAEGSRAGPLAYSRRCCFAAARSTPSSPRADGARARRAEAGAHATSTRMG